MFTQFGELKQHKQVLCGEHVVKCNLSGQKLAESFSSEKHMCGQFSAEQFHCSYCGKKCTDSSDLMRHSHLCVKISPTENLLTFNDCCNCAKQFLDHSHLRSNVQQLPGEKLPWCTHCGKKLPVLPPPHELLEGHSGGKSLERLNCCKDSITSLQNQHPQEQNIEKLLACCHCGKGFSKSANLKTHLRIHSGEKPFECSHCGKKFTTSSNLKCHMQIHSGEKLLACCHCGKKFAKSANLKTHMRTHSGEKPFECSHCGKKCTTSSNLKCHMQIHCEDKSFQCSMCGKKFRYGSNLKRHMQGHSGERPFKCGRDDKN